MLLIFTICVLFLAIVLLIGMHFRYTAEIKCIKDDSREAVRQAREDGFRRGRVVGWDEGTTEERNYWLRVNYNRDATEVIPVTKVEEGYPDTQWIPRVRSENDTQTALIPAVK